MGEYLTEKGKLLLSYFKDDTGEAHMDFAKSRKLAGYSSTTSNGEILRGALLEELRKAYDEFLVMEGGRAIKALTSVIETPTQLGAAMKIKAADSLLDRAGVVKKSQVEVKQDSPTAIIVIPAKNLN